MIAERYRRLRSMRPVASQRFTRRCPSTSQAVTDCLIFWPPFLPIVSNQTCSSLQFVRERQHRLELGQKVRPKSSFDNVPFIGRIFMRWWAQAFVV